MVGNKPKGVKLNITNLKQKEESRIKGYALDSAVAGIALADLSGSLTYVNRTLLGMWGYKEEKEVLGK